MKEFYLRYRGLHRWLLAVLASLTLLFSLRDHHELMNWLSDRVIMPFERAVASVCYLTTVSVAEVCYLAAVAVSILYLAHTVRRLVQEEQRGAVVYRFALTVIAVILTVYAALCLLWGVNYHADGFQEKSGVYARESTVEELEQVTAYFAENLAIAADKVERDADGAFAEPEAEIFAYSTQVYDPLYEDFPFLRLQDHVPKAVSLSRVMSRLDFTGFYFPFTGEANVNVDCPQSFLPATIAHEMAHQRGIASEQECNFLAIVASADSHSAAYRYSGWLMGYVYLGNALYHADQDKWQAIRDTLPDTVRLDLYQNNAYWALFEGAVNDAAQSVYDSFLKSQGEDRGIQSYGTVVDLLMTYYLPQI
ncbi:MAG: DUF3810 domain-containing protein [Eubacteriales bacterium]|nr:DUF3810 domain-containing protein [Eubacteriales bacterium]